VYVSQTDVPSLALSAALRIPQAIYENYAGDPTTPLNVGAALSMAPNGRAFRALAGASIAYGLTEGGSAAPTISLTAVGRRAVAPTEEGDDQQAKRQAFLMPKIVRDFLTKYDGKPFPPDLIAKNVLEEMTVPRDALERTLVLIRDGARELGMLTEIKGKSYVQIVGGGTPVTTTTKIDDAELEIIEDTAESRTDDSVVVTPPSLKQIPNSGATHAKPIFIGHGKNKEPLGKVQQILRSFGIPALVAEEQPNLARPIPDKVREVMSQCGSAILIFTKDELFFDKDMTETWRPSENVVHELGAASYAYGNRIVIMREEGLRFASNFESIGRINFETNNIEAKATDLLKELIGFGLVKITPAQ
jgi:predicted nucleotide-binding protein